MSLTLPSISFTFGVELAGRSDRRAQVFNSQGALVSGLTIGITEESTDTQAVWRVNLSGVPVDYEPGKVVFDFADDPDLRSAEESLAAYMILALGELRATQGVWPTVPDVERRLSAAGITLRLSGAERSARFTEVIGEVVEEVERETRRRFVADASDTTKRFDGRGSCELPIDEMVSLTSVKALGPTGAVLHTYDADAAGLKYEGPGKPQGALYTRYDGAQMYSRAFPLGRQNIEVTGKFGYAATIPEDLLDAVADECADRLTREAIYKQDGRIKGFKTTNGVSEDLQISEVDALKWHERYLAKLAFYTKGAGGLKRRVS